MSLENEITEKKVKIGIVGLGYVGLPLAVEMAKVDFNVVGIDLDCRKVDMILRGENYIPDLNGDIIKNLVKSGHLKATNDFKVIGDLDVIIICVPTPLNKTREPDTSYIQGSINSISPYLKKGQLIILESTSYPGTTEEIILPVIKKYGLEVGKDIYVAFSPERVDPGNKKYSIKNTPKVVGGVTKDCTRIASLLYAQVVDQVVSVSSPKTAEMTKLLENIFRCVNIALVNEIMILCDRMNIDVWEVVKAASTKPFGFMPFYPGPGLGGHCIPVDPFYLSWKAKEYDFYTEFIELAGKINQNMPYYVVSKIAEALNDVQKSIKGSKILILGVAYKKDIDDLRESPALKVIEILRQKGALVSYHDPYIDKISVGDESFCSQPLSEDMLRENDCAVVITDHSNVDYELIVNKANLVVDTRNALDEFSRGNIVKI
ncbi:nucleotide sugar dehydrogenase [Candidatus Oleimmundimicrobium sp.]|uniref:nucleotide sugar dehydrogenase n=1 Tax=Candidatus Oleimmundimicrobium sp. TaxID=3060597 RepID=UPI002720D8A8|nr:nucleotide sugar dehydrogenase [Candidatus Oleimmundimicrobium sp.]MDO8885570.1 nucleotide sugar dehydrogenase [Candidatus Oleimmundimicrobium sp.]